MKSTHTTKLYIAAFLCGWLCHVSAELDTKPSNVAGLVGSTITLSCSALDLPTDERVMWREYASNAGGQTVSDGKLINPSHPSASRYSITGSAMEFHLEIRDVVSADAGVYFCEDINGAPSTSRGYAELVVLDSDPVCQDYIPPSGIVVEANLYTAECEMRFRGNIKPVMTWSGPGEFTGNTSNPATSVWANVRFTAHRDTEDERFSCLTNFNEVVGAPPYYATNAPSYEYTYSTAPLVVVWGPNGAAITPIQGEYLEDDILTCNADCKPNCVYHWMNLRTQEIGAGPTYQITPDMVGHSQVMRCSVLIQVAGFIQTADVFLDCFVPTPTTPATTTTPAPSTPPPEDAPCLDLTGRWTSNNPDSILCIEVDTKGNMLTIMRNGSDPFFVTGNGKTVFNDYKHLGFTGVWPTGGSVGGFTGECHRCHGVEVIQLSGLHRNKHHSNTCGASAGTHLTNLYSMTRNGPPCRGQTLEVYDTKPGQLEKMGIKAKGEIFKPLAKN